MPSDPRRVKELFVAALELPDTQARQAFLDRECGEDAELRQRLEALLRAHDDPASALSQPLAHVAAAPPSDLSPSPPPRSGEEEEGRGEGPTLDDPITERPGTVIGPYKLLEQIGEGGFGVVFLAEQTEPVRRKVALKVLKPGMDTRQVIARFEAERQALAIMDHPNIAKVFDGGVVGQVSKPAGSDRFGNLSHTGRPYFVMELVKGVPITDFCDQNHLTPRQRLELFLPVCQAVQHAHQKGIIHRDLKPSNVLVSRHDATPVVKVIDFGVAKALGQELTDKTLFTGVAQMIGTPLYMSPEQAGMSDLDIDTRSDIYSLGVLLYELLTGTTPFSKERFKQAAYDEIRRIIREEEPPKPSTRLSQLNKSGPLAPRVDVDSRSESTTLASVAAQRHTEPAKLTKLVRGELDWIVMKALEKDRNRRYETANGFAMDVHRYLADEAVQACPPSAGYRLRKFLRRNKGPVLAASLVLLALVAGIVGTTWQAVRAGQRAEGERLAKERAQANFDLANAAVETYLGAVTDDPDLKRADFNRLRKKLLESAVPFLDKIAAQPSDDPAIEETRGRALLRLGSVRLTMGETEASRKDFQSMQGIFTRLAADFPDVPRHRHGQANSSYNLATANMYLGRHDEAEAAYRQAATLYEKLVAEFPSVQIYRKELADSHYALGFLLLKLGRFNDAEAAMGRALKVWEPLHAEFPTTPKYRQMLAKGYHSMGAMQRMQGDLPDAVIANRRALDIQDRLVAEFPTEPEFREDLAHTLMDLGGSQDELGEHGKAEAAHRRALDTWARLAEEFPTEPRHRHHLATGHENWAHCMRLQGKGSEAEAAFRQAQGTREKLAAAFPRELVYQKTLAQSCNSLGGFLHDLGRLPEAEVELRRAMEIHEKLVADYPTMPEFGAGLGGTYCNLGHLVRESGQPEASLEWFQKAIARLESALAQQPQLAVTREFLGNSYWGKARALDALDRRSEALTLYQETLAIRKAQLGPGHSHTWQSMDELADSYDGLGRYAEALQLHQELLTLRRDKLGLDHRETLKSIMAVAESLVRVDRGAEAVLLIDERVRRAEGKGIPTGIFRRLIDIRLRHFEMHKDAAECRATAEFWERLNWVDADGLYNAARNRSVCAAVIMAAPNTSGEDARRLAREQADLAMAWLHKAVAAGYKNSEHMKRDTDLDALREREDFKKLLAELEAKQKGE